MATLHHLYAAELSDLLTAEQRILQELASMSALAASPQLRSAFDEHRAETKAHVEQLGVLLGSHGSPLPIPTDGLAALIEDGKRRFANLPRGDVLDAALIAAAQRIEHYEIASYRASERYAEWLDDADAAQALHRILGEEERANCVLDALANRVIKKPSETRRLAVASTPGSSGLRYVSVEDLSGANRRSAISVRTHEGERLGTLDGVIIEPDSDQPLYWVVDARGWFAARRLVVPVGQVESDETGTLLFTTLTRNALARYPELDAGALDQTSPKDAAHYERHLFHTFAPDGKLRDGVPVYEHLPAYRSPDWLKELVARRLVAPVVREEPHVPDAGEIDPRSTEQPKTTGARIERYRER